MHSPLAGHSDKKCWAVSSLFYRAEALFFYRKGHLHETPFSWPKHCLIHQNIEPKLLLAKTPFDSTGYLTETHFERKEDLTETPLGPTEDWTEAFFFTEKDIRPKHRLIHHDTEPKRSLIEQHNRLKRFLAEMGIKLTDKFKQTGHWTETCTIRSTKPKISKIRPKRNPLLVPHLSKTIKIYCLYRSLRFAKILLHPCASTIKPNNKSWKTKTFSNTLPISILF